jgi:hypothetical protein
VANVIEILIQARNTAGAALKDASADVGRLRGALGGLSPALAMIGGQLGGMAGSLSAVAAGGIGMAGAVAIGGAALVTLGVAAFGAGRKLADTSEQLERMKTRTGVSIGNLQVMREVIKEGGGDAESLTLALGFLNRAIATQDPLLAQLGITTRDTFSAFQQLVSILSKSTDAANVAKVAQQLLGRGSGDLIASFKDLTTQIGPMGEKMRAAGLLITDDMLPRLRDLDAEMDTLSRNWAGAMMRLQAASIGPANAMADAFNRLFDAMQGRKASPEQIAARSADTLQRYLDILEANRAGIEAAIEKQEALEARIGKPAKLPALLDQWKAPGRDALDDLEKRMDAVRARIAQLRYEAGQLPKTVEGGIPKPAGPDPLKGLKFGEDKAADERAKAIAKIATAMGEGTAAATRFYAELQKLDGWKAGAFGPENAEKIAGIAAAMKVGAGEAAALYQQLAQLERMKMRDDIREKMDKLAWSMKSVADYTREAAAAFTDLVRGPKGVPEMPRGSAQERMGRELVKGAKYAPEGRPRALGKDEMRAEVAEAKRFMDDILSAASIAREGLQSVFMGLQAGFSQVLGGLTAKWRESKNAIVQIVTAMVDEILALLARLAAAQVFKFLLSFIPGGSALGIAAEIGGAGAAQGGVVRGPGGPIGDKIPAMLSDTEYVHPATVTRQPGALPLFEALRTGKIQIKDLVVRSSGIVKLAAGGFAARSETASLLSQINRGGEVALRLPEFLSPKYLASGGPVRWREGEPARSREPAVHHTVNQKIIVQTFSPRDVIGQYVSPAGAFRRASVQLATQTSY